jgi:hypothetical protein
MIRLAVWAILAMAFFVSPALACPSETEEARITEALTTDDTYFVIDGADLDKFVKNANELYNIGWQRATITKIYAIKSEMQADNPHFQIWHLFFVAPDGCIAYYQTVYGAVLALVLADDPQALLGGDKQ